MSNTLKTSGSCLCGEVTVHAQSASLDVGACHCSMCRKWTGGPLLAIDCNTNVSFSGEDNISTYASSDWAERGFCAKCGSHLYYKLKLNGQYIVPAGLFDNETAFNFDHQIFIEEKPTYYDFANNTKNMTGEEVFAQFSGE